MNGNQNVEYWIINVIYIYALQASVC